ncbi:MAG: response regulator [Magnetococcus sp. YQC-9]
MSQLFDAFIRYIMRWTPFRILWISVLLSEIGTGVIVAAMSQLLHGEVRQDFMVTGVIAALLVSLIVTFGLLRMVEMLRTHAHELQIVNLNLHQAREELRISNDRLNSSMVRMPIAFIVWDTGFRAVEWNPAAEKIFGYTRVEALGHTPLELFVPEAVKPLVAEAMAKLLNGEEAEYTAPGNNITQDGRIISCLWFNVPLRNQEQVVQGVLSMALDVTEQEALRHALQDAKEHAEAANQAKSEFLATMSHEIRTPMNVVLGLSEILLETDLDPLQRRYVKTMHQSGRTLLGVINDILDFSRIEAGRIQLSDLPYFPKQTVREIVDLMQMSADEKGLLLEAHFAADIPLAIYGDDGRMRQILINLLSNAIKFTERGRVDLHLTCPAATPGFLRFSVEDTGIGIAENQLRFIFEQFCQADAGITRRYGGTGLGLAITRRLVEQMGGQIQVESRAGHGSAFTFTLPFREADANALPDPVDERLPNAVTPSLRILLAEDQELNRMLFAGYLAREPHQLVMVHDGDQAVVRMCEESFDLVFMDVQMPRMNGYAATREIRAWERKSGRRAVPIIALSAHSIQDEQERSREAGCDAYLSKPLDKRSLLALIDRMARRHLVTTARPEGLRILLVEDTDENRFLFAAYLQKSPHHLVMAHNGLEALAKVREEVFDVVLMDVQMPFMDGYTATRRMRAWEAENGRTPMTIIALTAHAMEGESERSRQAGCDLYQTKPISKTLLLDTLAAIADQREKSLP